MEMKHRLWYCFTTVCVCVHVLNEALIAKRLFSLFLMINLCYMEEMNSSDLERETVEEI